MSRDHPRAGVGLGGARIALATAFIAGSSAALGAAAGSWLFLDYDRERSDLLEEIAARAEAGRLALDALDEAGRESERDEAMARAKHVLLLLAEATPHPRGPPRRWPVSLAVSLFVSALAGFWVWRRQEHPMAGTLGAARAFIHGDESARADPGRGGPEARELARAINALADRAVALRDQGRSAREEDVRQAAKVIEAFGRGDLLCAVPPVGDAFAPVDRALVRARENLLERVTRLHDAAMEAARAVADAEEGARQIERASLRHLESLERLTRTAEESERAIALARGRLDASVQSIRERARADRDRSAEIRACLQGAHRRALELRAAVVRIESVTASSAPIAHGLAVLGRLAGRIDDAVERTRVSTVIGEARAALESSGRELFELREEVGAVSEALVDLGGGVPEPLPDPGAELVEPITDMAAHLGEAVALVTIALRALERSEKTTASSGSTVARSAEETRGVLSELAQALSDIRTGASFPQAILKRLEEERVQASSPGDGRLSPSGEEMLKEVHAAAKAARQRLMRLVRATETAMDALAR